MNSLEKCEILTRKELIPTRRGTLGWSEPKDQQNKTNKFLSAFGVMHVIVKFQKDKGKTLKKHILKDIVDLMEKLKILQAVSKPFSLQMKKNVRPISNKF